MFNQTLVLGNLFQDPILRYTTQGTAIVNIRIGTNTYYKSDGENKKKTESHDVFFTGAVAENINTYLKKGSLVFVLGEQSTSIENNSVKGKIYHKNIKGHTIKFLDGKKKDHAYTDNNANELDDQHQDNNPAPTTHNEYQQKSAGVQQQEPHKSAARPSNQYQAMHAEGFAPDSDFE
ncbi:single-stranded DNA-binding protein [Pseudoalteromonas sp. APC 3358]|uniref:single-stranded DNA-binding protein n=1 Tax=unclassified Pseudoalteromonas TaxID=194690 RepID=UPI0003FFBD35|nr:MULTISPECIES: single-stranded DNA-binding protein [unclassified Pseudoalteromonas]MDN3384474.1 single-stranded DNA-binding protein [Pseudoalteromonas sp. APC 3358]